MAISNSLQTQRTGSKPATFSNFLAGDAIKRKINTIIGGRDGQRFITAITSAVSTNPQLQECDNSTILSAALLGESLKLSPSPQLGQYYMVPFNDKKRGCKVAQFQLGYKGYIQLAIRSGMYKKLNVMPIKDGELLSFDPLDESIDVKLIDNEVEREKAPTCGYYAMFEYTNGFKKAMYWSREKMMSHADKYSQSFHASDYQRILDGKVSQNDMWKYSSFWYKDFDGMACKTMLRQLISKWGVMSIDLQRAYESDDAMIREDGSAEYIEQAPEAADVEVQPVSVCSDAKSVDDLPIQEEDDPFFSGTER